MSELNDLISAICDILRTFVDSILFRFGFVVKPIKICWLITWRCNLTCHYCEIGQSNQELKKQELTLDEAKKIVPELKSLGVRFITFAGGEPLMYEDIFEIMRYCKDWGFIVGLVTNGTLINEKVAKKLANSGVDHIHISLDAPDELHDRIRHCNGCFRKVEEAIKWLIKYKEVGKYHIGLVPVVSGMNYTRLLDIFEYAKKMHLDSVGLQPFFVNQVRNKEMIGQLEVPNQAIPYLQNIINTILARYPNLVRNSYFYTYNIPRYFLDPKMKGTNCYAGGLLINILPDGTLAPCYYLQAKQAGSLRTEKLMVIVKKPEYRTLLNIVRKRKCPTCWCAVVHEYNLFFRPISLLKSLRLFRVVRTGK